eukprot:GFUD01054450.1.p1 GENE.GFUD01054450.1~~GFUD01054450.1.p1  ORF type:complete len:311 (+),score=71.16 GFUD01054450.1:185-1117(+)
MTEKALEEEPSGSRLGDFLREFIFQQDEVERPGIDLSDTSQFDINTKNIQSFFLSSIPGDVGAWFMEPEEASDRDKVVLYLHGVKGNRGRSYRVGLYNVLLQEGFKVLAIDYRGFGDSTDISEDEDTVVQDALVALDWLRNKVGENFDIYVWAHSLGTGIASHALAKEVIQKGGNPQVKGLILEAPFNNFTDEFIEKTSNTSNSVAKAALSALYALTGDSLPQAMLKLFNMEFNSDIFLPKILCPVMILHAEDDDKIPIELAQKLYESARAVGKKNIEFHFFAEQHGYKHHDIYQSENLPAMIRQFTAKV